MIIKFIFTLFIHSNCRSQWPRGLRRRSAAARLLRSWVRIPSGAWMFVCCECCVLSGWGLCDELITRPKESYRLWCVVVCDPETSRMRRPWPALGHSNTHSDYSPDWTFEVRIRERKKKICLIWRAPRPTLVPNQPAIQWEWTTFGKGETMDVTILLNSMWRSSTSGAIPPLHHISLMAVTGRPLPLPYLFHGESIFDRSQETAWLWHAKQVAATVFRPLLNKSKACTETGKSAYEVFRPSWFA